MGKGMSRDDLDMYINTIVRLNELISICEDKNYGVGIGFIPALKFALMNVKGNLYVQVRLSDAE